MGSGVVGSENAVPTKSSHDKVKQDAGAWVRYPLVTVLENRRVKKISPSFWPLGPVSEGVIG